MIDVLEQEGFRRASQLALNPSNEYPSFMNWAEVVRTQVKIMASHYRVAALKDYLEAKKAGFRECQWICNVYNQDQLRIQLTSIIFVFANVATNRFLDTLPLKLSIQLRVNREDITLTNNYAQIQNKLVILTQRDFFLFNDNTKAVKQQMSQILELNG